MNNKDLLKQYCDTGLQLPDYQIQRIPNNLKQTYIRKRLVAIQHGGELNELEWNLTDDNYKTNLIKKKNDSKHRLSNFQFSWCDDIFKTDYVNKRIENNDNLLEAEFDWCDNYNYKIKKILVLIAVNIQLKRYEFDFVNKEVKLRYLKQRINKSEILLDYEFAWCSDELKESIVKPKLRYGNLEHYEFEWCDDVVKIDYIMRKKHNGGGVKWFEFEWYEEYIQQHPEQ